MMEAKSHDFIKGSCGKIKSKSTELTTPLAGQRYTWAGDAVLFWRMGNMDFVDVLDLMDIMDKKRGQALA